MAEIEKKDRIAFRVTCDGCDLAKDFVPRTSHYSDINTAMNKAIEVVRKHQKNKASADHKVRTLVIPKPFLMMGGDKHE